MMLRESLTIVKLVTAIFVRAHALSLVQTILPQASKDVKGYLQAGRPVMSLSL